MFTLYAERQLCAIKLTESFEEFHFPLAYFKTWMNWESVTCCNPVRDSGKTLYWGKVVTTGVVTLITGRNY